MNEQATITGTDITPETFETAAFAYERWRDNFLKVIMRGACVIAPIVAIPTIIASPPIFAAIYIGATIALFLATFIRLSYWIRSAVVLTLIFLVATSDLLETGIDSDATIFFLTFASLSALLIGRRAGYIAIALNVTAIAIVGWLVLTGRYSLAEEYAVPRTTLKWILYILDMLLMITVLNTAINIIQREFGTVLQQMRSVFNTLVDERSQLESRVTERTKDLNRKAKQLQAAASIARQAATIQDLKTLLDKVTHLISDSFGFYHTGIFLIDQNEEFAVLQAASSEGGQQMLARGHRLRIGTQGIVGYAARQKKSYISLDIGEDAVFFDNPDLPFTHSEIALPMIVREKVIGVLDIQSIESQAFTQDDIEIMQTLSDQIALAIENARLFTDSQTTIQQLEAVTAKSTRKTWHEYLQQGKAGYIYTPLGISPLDQSHKATPATTSIDNARQLNIPIKLRGQKIGTIKLVRRGDETAWTDKEKNVTGEIAEQVGLALENTRLLEETRKRAQREQLIGEIASRMHETLDLDTILKTTAQELQQALDLKEAEIRLRLSQTEPISQED
jgi:GAF domain-containing protein